MNCYDGSTGHAFTWIWCMTRWPIFETLHRNFLIASAVQLSRSFGMICSFVFFPYPAVIVRSKFISMQTINRNEIQKRKISSTSFAWHSTSRWQLQWFSPFGVMADWCVVLLFSWFLQMTSEFHFENHTSLTWTSYSPHYCWCYCCCRCCCYLCSGRLSYESCL